MKTGIILLGFLAFLHEILSPFIENFIAEFSPVLQIVILVCSAILLSVVIAWAVIIRGKGFEQ